MRPGDVLGEAGASKAEDDDIRKMNEARRRMLGTWAFTVPIMFG